MSEQINTQTNETTAPREIGAVLTTKQSAQHLGLAVSTLNKWRCYGGGPKFLKLGRAVRYRKIDLDAFAVQCCQTSTMEIG